MVVEPNAGLTGISAKVQRGYALIRDGPTSSMHMAWPDATPRLTHPLHRPELSHHSRTASAAQVSYPNPSNSHSHASHRITRQNGRRRCVQQQPTACRAQRISRSSAYTQSTRCVMSVSANAQDGCSSSRSSWPRCSCSPWSSSCVDCAAAAVGVGVDADGADHHVL